MGASHVVIIDDHDLVAQALAVSLEDDGTHVSVVRVGDLTTDDMVRELTARAPDLVIVDLDLGDGRDGVDLVTRVAPGLRVLVLTGTTDEVWLGRSVEAGAVALLSKSCSVPEVAAVVADLLGGWAGLTRHQREEHLARLRRARDVERRRARRFDELTPREAEVLGSLVRGDVVDHIAERSVVSRATVRTQVRSILGKLGARSQVEAIALAREAAWVPPQER